MTNRFLLTPISARWCKVWLLAGLSVSWGVPHGVAWAQPQIDEESRMLQLQETARYTWGALQLQTSPLEPKETLRAIATYQKFYEETSAAGALPTDVAVAVTSRIAQLYGRDLEEFAKAKEIYAWALKQWGDTPYRARLQSEAEQMAKLTARPGPAQASKVPEKTVTELAPLGVTTVKPVKFAEVPIGVGAVKEIAPIGVGATKEVTPFGVGAVKEVAPIGIGAINEITPLGVGAVKEVTSQPVVKPQPSFPFGVVSATQPEPIKGVEMKNGTVGILPFGGAILGAVTPQIVVPSNLKVGEVGREVGRVVTPQIAVPSKPSFPTGVVSAIGPDLTRPIKVGNVTLKSGIVENGNVKSGEPGLVVTLEEMRVGRLSAAEAWQRGLLNEESVIVALSERGLQIGSDRGYFKDTNPKDYELRQKVVALLVEHSAPRLERGLALPQSLPWQVQASVGHFYRDQGDTRAVAWYEAALKHSLEQGPEAGESGEQFNQHIFYLIEPLAGYYAKQGQIEKAAQTWERVPQMVRQKPLAHPALASGWWVPDAMLEAARLYNSIGHDKAKELYAQIPQYGDGWLTVLSFYDQALPLIHAGKLDQAKAILSRPITATRTQVDGSIAQNAWLASLAYQQGDLESALRYGEQVKEVGQGGKLTKESTENLYQMGLDIYNRSGGWKNQPIQTDTKQVVFQANLSQPEQPLYARFRIKTYGDKSITASVDNPNIQARVLPVNNWQRGGLNAQEEEMEVIVQSNSLNPFQEVPLVLSSATRGKTTVTLSFTKAQNYLTLK